MPDRAPTGRLAPWDFDPAACRADLDAFEHLLSAKQALSERGDISPFFHEHPHLSAFLGSYNPNVTTFDRLAVEVGLFGQFAADALAGDARNRAYCFVEFEDGRAHSVFANRRRQMTDWAPRFDHANSQIIDWLWLLDDQSHTLAFEEQFGQRPIDVTALLVAGRDSSISAMDRRRLQWRRKHVIVNSHHIYCCTFDDLLQDLRGRLAWAMAAPPPT